MRWPIWRVAVAERSMEPAFRPGDMLLVWRGTGTSGRRCGSRIAGSAELRSPVRVRAGQVVIARHPGQADMLLIKRVAWHEPDGWWLTSDNPGPGTVDSFRFGPVRAELIEGRVVGRYWPPRR